MSFESEGVKEVVIDVGSQKEASAAEQASAEPTLLADPTPIKTNKPKTEPTMGNSQYPVRERKPVVRYSEESYAKTVLIPDDVAFYDLFLFESNLAQ